MAQRFKADELAIVRDFMRQAKEVFQRQVSGSTGGEPGPDADEPGGAPPALTHRYGAVVGGKVGWPEPVPGREGSVTTQ